MQQYLTQISRCPLFTHISSSEILHALNLLSAKIMRFEKDAIILHEGTPPKVFGVVLDGSVHIVTHDASGNHTLIATRMHGDLFAETFLFAGIPALPVSVVAASECVVLFLDHSRMSARSQSEFPAHSILISNLIRIITRKNLLLSQKINILSQRTTRDKLITYLQQQRQINGSSRFTIPLNRQELADYLCIDRSAMSAELSKMKKAGLIACRKNEFEILALQHEELPQDIQA